MGRYRVTRYRVDDGSVRTGHRRRCRRAHVVVGHRLGQRGRPVTEWITEDDVQAALGLSDEDLAAVPTDAAWLTLTTTAVNRFVDDTRASPAVYPVVVDDRTRWGAVQLATRWFSRRNSNDISAFVELGGPPPSIDRDIEISLQLNRFYGPAIA